MGLRQALTTSGVQQVTEGTGGMRRTESEHVRLLLAS